MLTGPDATRLINRVIARDIRKVAVDQVIYCCWCDEQGKVIDDGTITRLGENTYRWTAADPSLHWFSRECAWDWTWISRTFPKRWQRWRCKGRHQAALLERLVGDEIPKPEIFSGDACSGSPGWNVEISRTGYTGDLGYELWIPWDEATKVWDALMEAGPRVRHSPRGNAGAGRGAYRSWADPD